jgi:hypothetical protein
LLSNIARRYFAGNTKCYAAPLRCDSYGYIRSYAKLTPQAAGEFNPKRLKKIQPAVDDENSETENRNLNIPELGEKIATMNVKSIACHYRTVPQL